MRLALATAAAAALILMAAPGAAAQPACGAAGAWAGLAAGAVRYDLAGPVNGRELGAEGGLETSLALLRAGYRALSLGSAGPTPHLVRGSAHRELTGWRGLSLCAGLHAGGSRLARDDDRATVVAGGPGLAVALPVPAGNAVLVPFVEVRGLAAASTGQVTGLDVAASGLSLGAEAGVRVAGRRLEAGLTLAADGFASALGVTPYPARAGRLVLAYRF